MEMERLDLPAINPFASDYSKGKMGKGEFFHYDWSNHSDLEERAMWLDTQTYDREAISNHIEQYMNKFGVSDSAIANINALKEDALVVIGGQQAGILTGPLYTIHKVITVIKLAKKQSELLGRKVIPIFWIAGEDHDFQEVNHLFTPVSAHMEKWTYPKQPSTKKMVSDIELEQELTFKWIEDVMASLGETDRTNTLLDWLQTSIDQSVSFTDFFTFLINDLFNDMGLLLVDSGSTELRKLAGPHYRQFAMQSTEISKAILNQQQKVISAGYKPAIETSEANANLFYYDARVGDRILLETVDGGFKGKNGEISFQIEEAEAIFRDHPERLSTNVVTRPLLQEKLFPVLGFVGGPGELAYWAEIKPAFELLNLKMPPIWPRLSFTLLERSVEADVNDLGLSLVEVLTTGCQSEKEHFLEGLKSQDLEEMYEQLKTTTASLHQSWADLAVYDNPGTAPLFEKNRQYVLTQIDFMHAKLLESIERRHEDTIQKFNRIECALHPFNGPQERIWNPFYFFNKYGASWIDYLLENDFEFDGSHYVIKL